MHPNGCYSTEDGITFHGGGGMETWIRTGTDGAWYHLNENGYMETGWLLGKVMVTGGYLDPARGEKWLHPKDAN